MRSYLLDKRDSVVLELHALAASQTAINEQVNLLDREYVDFMRGLDLPTESAPAIQPTIAAENRFTVKTRLLNKWSLRSLVAGIVFLCIFSAANLPFISQEKKMPKQQEISTQNSKGSFVPPRNILPPPPPPTPAPAPTGPSEAAEK